MRFGKGVLVGMVYHIKRDLCVAVHFDEHNICDIVLEERNMIFVAEDPEFYQKGPFGIDLGWHSLVLRQALSVEPDLKSLKDFDVDFG
jgi:hypothetical protein